ncbi:MAG: 1-acyl-sn-glycerol-3-phosphate acyltransferase [Spirochaetaceae bacterium]|jgi:glycerol-3-phosphate O-acyltransferase|nr:1-acyl-sn-glycerol-3-phosphate acyltransferase [Spirochaetaceae bacterium]
MDVLSEVFRNLIKEVLSLLKSETLITEHNVYQQAVPEVLPFIDRMIDGYIQSGSGMSGMEHLADLYEKARSGKSCLLFLEHYSNLDLPLFSYLARKEGGVGKDIAGQLVAIAGRKLNEDSATVAAFAAGYTRIVIFPSRALIDLDAEKDREELVRSNAINRAAMKTLNKIKYEGKLILVFPAGTRFRPWDPASKRGVREIDSYIKSFDYFCPIGIAGELLHIRQGDMMDDFISGDVVRYTAGPVQSCREFREGARARAEADGMEDKKQAAVDELMKVLDGVHAIAVAEREKILAGNTR